MSLMPTGLNQMAPAPGAPAGAFWGTPFHSATAAHNKTTWWYAWDKYVIPDAYTDMPSELRAIRGAAALIDMSPLPKMEIAGPEAHRLVNRLMTRDLSAIAVGQAMYAPWCNEHGLLIGDGLVFRSEEQRFIISGEASHAWFAANATGLDVQVRDVSDEFGVLSLQGPRAFDVLAAATGRDWSALKFSAMARARIADVDLFVARQGFTGERGFELWVPRDGGAAVWNVVYEAGEKFGIRPAGEYAVDVARVEAGLILVSADYTGAGPDQRCAHVQVAADLTVTPYQAGLGKFVDLGRDFVGRDALAREQGGPQNGRRLVGLRYDAAEILRLAAANSALGTALSRVYWGSMTAWKDGAVVGRASSLCFSPTLRRAISFGFLPGDLAEPGASVDVEMKDDSGTGIGLVCAEVTRLPFVELKRSSG
ncbi:MAG: aminomethyltransferase family protein [Rhizobiaceae bacterium]|nr:aminomethyltransferase family protein [Rhizobiaceae bacterium]